MAPPPPAPAPPPPPPAAAGGASVDDTSGALFAEINSRGANGLRGSLKKATKGPVNDAKPDVKQPPPSTPKKSVKLGGEPKCALAGKKWMVEYQNGSNGDKAINLDTDIKQTVYIYKCHDSLIKINGKVNAIVLDSCTKTACIFDEALASVEVVNSSDMQIQCTKNAPAINIDGCVSVTYFMSPKFASAQIITAKSAAVNLIRPADDDDIVETPIPEQFCTTWKNGQWVTECVDHSD